MNSFTPKMASPETAAAVLISRPEVVQKLQVQLRPTEERIDAPPNSQTPTIKFRTREGNSFRFENALRFTFLNLTDCGSIELEIETIWADEISVLGLLPIELKNNVLHLGQNSRIGLRKIKSPLKKAEFAISLPREIRIIDEYIEPQRSPGFL